MDSVLEGPQLLRYKRINIAVDTEYATKARRAFADNKRLLKCETMLDRADGNTEALVLKLSYVSRIYHEDSPSEQDTQERLQQK